MPEVHVIGEIEGATGFSEPNLFCKWKIVADEHYWTLLEGFVDGQTQVDMPEDNEFSVWAHPIDLHYKTTSLKGWPKLSFQVWSQDYFGRNSFAGYGFCHLPTSPGNYNLEIATFRPKGSMVEEIQAFFLGGSPQFRNEELIYSTSDRYRLETKTTGKIYLQLSVILKDFGKYGLNWSKT